MAFSHFRNNFISITRFPLDKLSKAYTYKIDVINVITAPKIEMLIIHNEGAYERFKRSGKKPSDYCKMDLHMRNVKAYDFVKDYFCNPKILVEAIREYRRVANIPKLRTFFSVYSQD